MRRGGAERLCRTVSAEVARRDKALLADVVEVQVVTGEFHLADYFSGKRTTPVAEVVHDSARVERERP